MQSLLDSNILKVYKCYHTVIEMLVDRNYTHFKKIKDLENFEDSGEILTIEEAQYQSFDKFKELLFQNEHSLLFLTLLAEKKIESDSENSLHSKIFVFFCPNSIDVKFVRGTILEIMKFNNVRNSILVSISSLGGAITNQAAKMMASEAPAYIMELFTEKELIVNISRHRSVPQHILLSEIERDEVIKAYSAKNSNFPTIKVYDPMARYLGLRVGQMVKILRKSETAGYYTHYRICTA
jgi:DNA-directed RNA polymerase I, II, and III subunit RPABC1